MNPDSEWLIDQLPWELDYPSAVATFAMYEAYDKPITLKNGSECIPKGWLSFLRMKAEDFK